MAKLDDHITRWKQMVPVCACDGGLSDREFNVKLSEVSQRYNTDCKSLFPFVDFMMRMMWNFATSSELTSLYGTKAQQKIETQNQRWAFTKDGWRSKFPYTSEAQKVALDEERSRAWTRTWFTGNHTIRSPNGALCLEVLSGENEIFKKNDSTWKPAKSGAPACEHESRYVPVMMPCDIDNEAQRWTYELVQGVYGAFVFKSHIYGKCSDPDPQTSCRLFLTTYTAAKTDGEKGKTNHGFLHLTTWEARKKPRPKKGYSNVYFSYYKRTKNIKSLESLECMVGGDDGNATRVKMERCESGDVAIQNKRWQLRQINPEQSLAMPLQDVLLNFSHYKRFFSARNSKLKPIEKETLQDPQSVAYVPTGQTCLGSDWGG